ncbi:hypothetical protein GPK89_06110 [Gemmiger formicilis]|uniref:hypothetical protein n=1 Tax=Gemmiger formicilis TaxID=745368 RepID=UPI001C01B828|nr:hypothetical protein [Gemmiger formicilis]MBT9674301.1 hypothetical protein [Gemmiger formicilis]
MAILFFILRLIGWVLLTILLLLVVALLLPLGIQAAYRPGEAFAKAFYGPLKFTLWPRGGTQGTQSKAKSKPTQKSPKKPDTSPPPTVIKTVEGEKASVTVKVEPDKSALPAPAPRPAATAAQAEAKITPASAPEETPPAQNSKGGLPFGISDHIDAAMQLLSDDPMAFAKCMLGHTGWLGRRLLRTVRVQHLDVFWTVTADEASTTAELYGAEMAALNNLLAFLQQYIRLQSDRLWLEPDFTGERTGERNISFRVSIGTGVLLWLLLRVLWRLWKNPQLQPAVKNS